MRIFYFFRFYKKSIFTEKGPTFGDHFFENCVKLFCTFLKNILSFFKKRVFDFPRALYRENTFFDNPGFWPNLLFFRKTLILDCLTIQYRYFTYFFEVFWVFWDSVNFKLKNKFLVKKSSNRPLLTKTLNFQGPVFLIKKSGFPKTP